MSLVVVADYWSKPGRWADVAAQTQASSHASRVARVFVSR